MAADRGCSSRRPGHRHLARRRALRPEPGSLRHPGGLHGPRHRDGDAPAANVPNYGRPARPRLVAGLALAVEPMVTLGTKEVSVLEDDWTVVTDDGSRAAHFEHTFTPHPDRHLGADGARRGEARLAALGCPGGVTRPGPAGGVSLRRGFVNTGRAPSRGSPYGGGRDSSCRSPDPCIRSNLPWRFHPRMGHHHRRDRRRAGLRRRRHRPEPARAELRETATALTVYVGAAVLFGAWIWLEHGHDMGVQFYAGWLTEYFRCRSTTSSVFIILMAALRVPREYQQEAPHGQGIILALVFRGIFIALGYQLIANSRGSSTLRRLPRVHRGLAGEELSQPRGRAPRRTTGSSGSRRTT